MEQFIIKKDFITVSQFLKVQGYITSGGQTGFFLDNNKVLLNGVSVTQKKKKIFNGDLLFINNDGFKFSYD